MRQQTEQSLEHLIGGETLAALGAWDGLEKRLAFIGFALQLLAQLYPKQNRRCRVAFCSGVKDTCTRQLFMYFFRLK